MKARTRFVGCAPRRQGQGPIKIRMAAEKVLCTVLYWLVTTRDCHESMEQEKQELREMFHNIRYCSLSVVAD